LSWMPVMLPAAIVALIVCRIFRDRFWSVYCWVPCVILTVGTTAGIILRIIWMASVRGPDAGFVAMQGMIVFPALGACLVFGFLCWFCRPAREMMQWHIILILIVLWVAPVLLYVKDAEERSWHSVGW
jgi:hypothetical protein